MYDVLAVGLLISIHHRHFKPRRKGRPAAYAASEDGGSDEDESENEHVSVYEDDQTSMKSGTILHGLSDRDEQESGRAESYHDFGDALAGSAIHAALAGSVEFRHVRRYRCNTGGEQLQLAKSELLPVKEEDSFEYAESPLLKGKKESDTYSTGSGTKTTQPLNKTKEK